MSQTAVRDPRTLPSPAFENKARFPALYEGRAYRDIPEQPQWLSRDATPWSDGPAPEWADVLIDFRLNDLLHRRPLPETTEELAQRSHAVWPSSAKGWSLERWHLIVGEEKTGEGESIYRFTCPDGFRIAIALTQCQDTRPADGRMSILMPTMRFPLLALTTDTPHMQAGAGAQARVPALPYKVGPAAGSPNASVLALDGFAKPTQTYSLPSLRAAVADPATWFGTTHWRRRDLLLAGTNEHFEPHNPDTGTVVSPERVLLSFASAGATSFSQIASWAQTGMDSLEVASWLDENETNNVGWSDDDIRSWCSALGTAKRNRTRAKVMHRAGLTPTQGATWAPLLAGSAVESSKHVPAFEEAGWTVQDATDFATAAHKLGITRNGVRTPALTLSDMQEWLPLSPARALGYLRAQVPPAEARALEDSGQAPDETTLSMLAALNPIPSPPF